MLVIEIMQHPRGDRANALGHWESVCIGRVLDHETEVEKAVIQELETAFKSFGIEANILSVEGMELMGSRLEVPLKLRTQRQVIP